MTDVHTDTLTRRLKHTAHTHVNIISYLFTRITYETGRSSKQIVQTWSISVHTPSKKYKNKPKELIRTSPDVVSCIVISNTVYQYIVYNNNIYMCIYCFLSWSVNINSNNHYFSISLEYFFPFAAHQRQFLRARTHTHTHTKNLFMIKDYAAIKVVGRMKFFHSP